MPTHKHTLILIPVTLLLIAIGCEEQENTRLAEMAEKQLARQAAHNQQMAELQHEVAEGARRLVEADAAAREDMVGLHRDVQAERIVIGQQRDLLEHERRDLAAKRRLDPIIATAITNVGLLLACLLPLVLCWHLLHRRVEPADDQAVVEILLEDLVANQPLLLSRADNRHLIDYRDGSDAPRLPDVPGDPDQTV